MTLTRVLAGLGDNPFVRMVHTLHISPIPRNLTFSLVKTGVWEILWDMRSTFHRLPLEPRHRHAIQDDRHLPDVCQSEERLPNVSLGS